MLLQSFPNISPLAISFDHFGRSFSRIGSDLDPSEISNVLVVIDCCVE